MSRLFSQLPRIFPRKTLKQNTSAKANNSVLAPASANSDIVGQVRTAITDFVTKNGKQIKVNENVKIVYKFSNLLYQIQFGKEQFLDAIDVDTLLESTKQKKPMPISIGTQLIATKNYGLEKDKTSFKKGDKLIVTTIENKNEILQEVTIDDSTLQYFVVLNIVRPSNNVRKVERMAYLNGSQLFEYTELAPTELAPTELAPRETMLGGNRKTNTFLKKQRKSKKNYMQALRNFVKTRKRRKTGVY
jgi:hypothetical protein